MLREVQEVFRQCGSFWSYHKGQSISVLWFFSTAGYVLGKVQIGPRVALVPVFLAILFSLEEVPGEFSCS